MTTCVTWPTMSSVNIQLEAVADPATTVNGANSPSIIAIATAMRMSMRYLGQLYPQPRHVDPKRQIYEFDHAGDML